VKLCIGFDGGILCRFRPTGPEYTFGKVFAFASDRPGSVFERIGGSKVQHNFTSFAFVAGLILIAVIFFRDNLFEKVDADWIKQGGGFIKSRHAPAGRFNPGEKLVYWLSLAGRSSRSLRRGFCLLFPFFRNRYRGICSWRRSYTPWLPCCSSP